MPGLSLEKFIAEARQLADAGETPADCVDTIAPLMLDLLQGDRSFLKAEHYRSDPDHYARNAIHISDDGRLSLFALVWNPGQWTPIHDHGTWGVVGVVRGVLEERAFIRTDGHDARDDNIALARGGLILVGNGSISTFVPNPDHIHKTGVSEDRPQCVSLHLYGRDMSNFHVYDKDAGTRKLIDVRHQ